MPGYHWASDELAWLRKNYPVKTTEECVRHLGRTATSIRMKAHKEHIHRIRKGVPRPALWAQSAQIVSDYRYGKSRTMIAAAHGVPVSTVASMLRVLGEPGLQSQNTRLVDGVKHTRCYRCHVFKPRDTQTFCKSRRSRDGVTGVCKACKNARQKARIDADPFLRLRQRMSTAVSRTIASRGTTKWERVLPYSVDELRDHLERQFKGAMSWGNYGRAWHIDHIRPVSSFRFVSPEDPAFSECWSLVNLRPLWRRSNIRKSDTWDGQTFLAM